MDLVLINNDSKISDISVAESISKTCDYFLLEFEIDFSKDIK